MNIFTIRFIISRTASIIQRSKKEKQVKLRASFKNDFGQFNYYYFFELGRSFSYNWVSKWRSGPKIETLVSDEIQVIDNYPKLV